MIFALIILSVLAVPGGVALAVWLSKSDKSPLDKEAEQLGLKRRPHEADTSLQWRLDQRKVMHGKAKRQA